MAGINDIKDAKQYIDQLKEAVADLCAQNDFKLFIYVNQTPIDEFFINLETLNPEEDVNTLKSILESLNSETSGITVKTNGENTYNPIDKSAINGIGEFEQVVSKMIASLKDKLDAVSTVQPSQVQPANQVVNTESEFIEFDDDFADLDEFAEDLKDTISTIDNQTVGTTNTSLDKVNQTINSEEVFSEFTDDFADALDEIVGNIDSAQQPQVVKQSTDKPQTKFSDNVFEELKKSVDELTKQLETVADVYISSADEKLSISDKGFKTEHGYDTELSIAGENSSEYAFDYMNTQNDDGDDIELKPEDAIKEAVLDISGGNVTDLDAVISDMKTVSSALPEFNKALQLAGIELTDISSLNTKEALEEFGVRTTKTVDDKVVDRDITEISDEEKHAAVYAKATKDLVEVIKSEAYARSEEWDSDLVNNKQATAMLSAVSSFATFNDMRDDAPKKPDTSERDKLLKDIFNLKSLVDVAPMEIQQITSDPNKTQEQKAEEIQSIKDYVESANSELSELNSKKRELDVAAELDKKLYDKELSQFNAKVFQEQKTSELYNTVAKGTDQSISADDRIKALEEVKLIIKDVDKALKVTGVQEISEYQTAKASAQEFLDSNDVSALTKIVKADKDEITTILKNDARFTTDQVSGEDVGYTSVAEKEVFRLLEKSAKDLELFDNALKNAGKVSLSNKPYFDLKNARDKLYKEANDPETGKSSKLVQERVSKKLEEALANFGSVETVEPAEEVTTALVKADSEWLNNQTRAIQSEYSKSSVNGTYTSLQKLIKDINSQVYERENSDNPLDVKQSELNKYYTALDKATKYINATKKANEAERSEKDLAKQGEALTQLERDVNDYKVPSLDGKSREEQISVFEKAAAATKEYSDKLVEYSDSSFKTQRNRIQKVLDRRLRDYQSKIKSLGGDTSNVDKSIKESIENDKEINKRSALSAITNEIRQSKTNYNASRETKSPAELYKDIEGYLKNVENMIKEAVIAGNSEEEANALADVFKRDFLGYQSSKAVAAVKQYVTLDGGSIDQLVEALGDTEKVQSLPDEVPDYIKNIVAKSDSRSDVGRAIINQQEEIKTEQLAKEIADKQAEIDTDKERVQSFKNNNDTTGASKALENLAGKQRELSDLLKAKGDDVKSNKALLDSSASMNEAIDIKTDVPLELQQLNKELYEKLKEIDDTIIDAKEKLAAQKNAILLYDKNIQANASKFLPNQAAQDSYSRTKATVDKKVANTQTSVYKQELDLAKANVTSKKAVYDTVSKSDSGASTQDVITANQEYIDSLRTLVALQEKYSNTDAVKDTDITNTTASITKAEANAEILKTTVTREATEQLKLFEQELKQIQSDKTLSTADKAYYTQKLSQQAQAVYEKEKSSKDQMDVTPDGQVMPHTNEETVNAYKEFAEQAQKTTSYLHQQSVEEERLASNTVQVKQQEQLISKASSLKDRAKRTRELADIYRQQSTYARDLAEKETLLAKAEKADADAVKLEQQAYQEFLNSIKGIGQAISNMGKSVQAAINEIVSLVRAGINVTNKYINTTVNGTRKVFSATQRVLQLFGSLSNRVRQTASTFINFTRQAVSGLQRVSASLANLVARFKTVIDKGDANPLRKSWTELNSAISLAQRTFNGVFNNALLQKAIKFDSTIASITMLLGDEATDNAQEFAQALQDAFGVSYSKTISDLQEITSLLQSAGLQGIGASNEQIGKAAMDFYAMSQYLAALGMAGGSASEVMNKLQSGMKGMTQSIDDLGLSVRESDMNQFLKDAKKAGKIKVDVKFSELSEANKEAVRLAAIIKQFQDTKNIGNFKDLMDQPYYQVSLIKARVEEIGTMIGKIFEGIISKFLPAVMTFLDFIQRMLGNLAASLHIDLSGDKVQKSLSDISKEANHTEDSLDGAKKSAKEFDGTAGFDEIESLNSSTGTDDEELNLGSLLDDVGTISGMLEKLAKDSLKQTNEVKSNFQKMIDDLVGHHVDLTFGFNKALAKKQLKDIWGNLKRWWKAVKGTGLYLSVRIAEDLKAGRIVNDVLRIVEALTRIGAVISEYLDPIIRDFYDKHLSKYFQRASNSIHNFSNGMKQLADVVELIFDRKTSNAGIEKAINDLAKTHPHLANIAKDLYVLRDNFSGFFAIFQDNPVKEDLLKLDNLKKQFPILTQVLSTIDAIVDLVRVLYKDYIEPLLDEVRSSFDLLDFLNGVEMKIRDLTSLLDSIEFQITVKDNFDNLLQLAKTTFENVKSIFSGTLAIGAALVTPTDNTGNVTSQSNGGTSIASMAVDSYDKQSTELQSFLSKSAEEASVYITKHKDEISGIIDTILGHIEKQLESLIVIIGKISQYLVEHPEFLERIAEMVTSILEYVNKNADTILWLLDTIVGFTFDNFNNLLNSLQIIFDYISANKESVQEVLNMFTNFSGEALTSIAQIVTSLFDYISQHKEEIQSLMDKVLSFLSWLSEHPGVIVTVFKLAVLGKVVSVIKTLLSPLGSLFSILQKIFNLSKGKGIFTNVVNGVKGIAGKAKGLFNFGKGANAAASGAKTLGIATKSVPLIETTATTTELATTASTTGLAGAETLNVVNGGITAGTALAGAAGIVAGIAGGVKDAVDGVKKFTDESSTLGDKFAAGITSAVMSDESGLTGALKNGAKWGAVGAGIGTLIAPGIGTAIGGAVGSVGGAIAGAIDTKSAIDKVKEIGSGIKEVGVSLKDQFGNSMKESVDTITSDTATIPDKVASVINITLGIFAKLPMSVFNIGKKLVTALCQNESIQKAFQSARDFATKLWNEAPKIFSAIGSRIADAFKPMGDAIGNIFSGIKDMATGAFDYVADKVGSFIGGIFDDASSMIDKAESTLGIDSKEEKSSTTTTTNTTTHKLVQPKMQTYTTVNDPKSAGVASAKGSTAYKELNASDKHLADVALADYSMGRISKSEANNRLKKFSSKLYIRKLGGTVPAGNVFIANEPGNPEYIGKLGTHTAVANNTMITDAMETAIYNGLVDAWNQRSYNTANTSSEVNVNLSGFGLIDKQTLRRLAQMLAPYFEANTKSFRTV